MRWSERQRAMLREMGIPPFWPVAPDEVADNMAASPVESPITTTASAAPVVAPVSVAAHTPAPISPSSAPARSVVSTPVSAAPLTQVTPAHQLKPLADVSGLDWDALRAAAQACQACDLSRDRQQALLGEGNIEADWMIVGEAPGDAEDKAGELVLGRAGELFDRMLEAVGLTRQEGPASKQVYVTNALKCKAPSSRSPTPDQVQQCEPYLSRQIALVKPRVILAMGRLAAQALLNTREPLGKLRGRLHQVHGVPVVVTFHPTSLLRSPTDKALAWDDLCLAREVVLNSGASQSTPAA